MLAILTVIKIKFKYITIRSKDSHFVIIVTKSLNTKRFLREKNYIKVFQRVKFRDKY